MKLAKKYTHYVARTDSPAKIIPCTSLDEAKRRAEVEAELAHHNDLPDLSVCDRAGTEIAAMHKGEWINDA